MIGTGKRRQGPRSPRGAGLGLSRHASSPAYGSTRRPRSATDSEAVGWSHVRPRTTREHADEQRRRRASHRAPARWSGVTRPTKPRARSGQIRISPTPVGDSGCNSAEGTRHWTTRPARACDVTARRARASGAAAIPSPMPAAGPRMTSGRRGTASHYAATPASAADRPTRRRQWSVARARGLLRAALARYCGGGRSAASRADRFARRLPPGGLGVLAGFAGR